MAIKILGNTIKPDAIMAVAVKAIQELSAKNDALEARIAQLESN
jgi:cell division protein FtsB